MKKVNSIRIFFILTVLFIIGCYQIANLERDKEELPLVEETESPAKEALYPVSQIVEYKFVIVEEFDYLTVYFADRKTVYEYTDIRYSDLEDTLRQKIRKGYWILDEEELFGFLENYSS